MNDHMKKFRRKVIRGAILKSALAALIIACGALLIAALASWLFGFKEGIWLAVGLFAVTFIVASLLFFFLKYRPTAKDVAREIDAIGLEERLITMLELEGDDSYIARMQREDAQRALKTADHTLIKVAASVALCTVVGISAIFGAGALTVDSLYVAGVIPSGIEAASYYGGQHEFNVNYTVDKTGGKLYYWEDNGIGEEVTDTLVVKEGEEAPAVIAVPDAGYAFTGWSDGLYDPYRCETNVTRNISVRAMFESIALLDDLLDDSEGGDSADSGGNPGDQDAPGSDGSGDLPPQDSPQRPSTGAGGNEHTDSNKQINDGNTFYGDEYGDAYNNAMDRLGDGSDIPGGLQGGISGYLDSIGKGNGDESGEGGEGGN